LEEEHDVADDTNPHAALPNQAPYEVTKKNKHIARRLNAAYSSSDDTDVKKFISRKVRHHSPRPPSPDDPNRPATPSEEVYIQRGSIPDMHFVEENIIGEGDMVVLHWRGKGTFTGELYGKRGKGQKLDIRGIEVMRFEDGQVIEHWDNHAKPRLEALIGVAGWDPEMEDALRRAGLI
jgi:predicted ester cyclase